MSGFPTSGLLSEGVFVFLLVSHSEQMSSRLGQNPKFHRIFSPRYPVFLRAFLSVILYKGFMSYSRMKIPRLAGLLYLSSLDSAYSTTIPWVDFKDVKAIIDETN